MIIWAVLVISSIEIGFELNKARQFQCIEVDVPEHHILKGTYYISGIHNINALFTISNSNVNSSTEQKYNPRVHDFELRSDNMTLDSTICIKCTDTATKWVDINFALEMMSLNSSVELIQRGLNDVSNRLIIMRAFLYHFQNVQEVSMRSRIIT
jgi:hypothetical protein